MNRYLSFALISFIVFASLLSCSLIHKKEQTKLGAIKGRITGCQSNIELLYGVIALQESGESNRVSDSAIIIETDSIGQFYLADIEIGVYDAFITGKPFEYTEHKGNVYMAVPSSRAGGCGRVLVKNIRISADSTSFLNSELPIGEYGWEDYEHYYQELIEWSDSFQQSSLDINSGIISSGTLHCYILNNLDTSKSYKLKLFKYAQDKPTNRPESLWFVGEYFSDSTNVNIFTIPDLQTGVYKVLIPAPKLGMYPCTVDSICVLRDSTSAVFCEIETPYRGWWPYTDKKQTFYPWVRWVVANGDTSWIEQVFDSLDATIRNPQWLLQHR